LMKLKGCGTLEQLLLGACDLFFGAGPDLM